MTIFFVSTFCINERIDCVPIEIGWLGLLIKFAKLILTAYDDSILESYTIFVIELVIIANNSFIFKAVWNWLWVLKFEIKFIYKFINFMQHTFLI